ncbi:MAG: DUF4340 domain-containing protein [Rhodospirillales bacterium]|nr:DUF4340 domain-containing protein [Rhodospirillales bacterium]
MTPKTFLCFAAVTAAIIVGAAFSISARYTTDVFVLSDAPMFPDFTAKVNDVTEISVQDNEKTIVIRRKGDGWVLPERSDYRASEKTVRKFLVSVAELRVRERKTKNPELHARLQVEDLTGKKNLSKRLIVKAKDGSVLADTLIGRQNFDISGTVDAGRYVRKSGDPQSWLSAGTFDLPDSLAKWVDAEFMDVNAKRVKTVTTLHPGGKNDITVERIEKSGTKFRVLNVPEGREVEYQIDVDNMSDGVASLELEDVRKPGEIEFPADQTIKTTLYTYDGLIVEAELTAKDEDSIFWARFKAKAADDAGDKKKIEEEAAAINKKVSDWVYQLPAFKYRYMSRKMEDILKKKS